MGIRHLPKGSRLPLGNILQSNQKHLYEVQIVTRWTFPHIRIVLNFGLVLRWQQPFCDKAWQSGQNGLNDVEVVRDSLCHIRWRKLDMFHRHTGGVHTTTHVAHSTVTEYGHHLDRSSMGTARDVHTTSDEQQCQRKQQRQHDMSELLHFGCKDRDFFPTLGI